MFCSQQLLGKDEKRGYDQSDLQTQGNKSTTKRVVHLDKNYVIGLQSNGTLTEDLTWLSGTVRPYLLHLEFLYGNYQIIFGSIKIDAVNPYCLQSGA